MLVGLMRDQLLLPAELPVPSFPDGGTHSHASCLYPLANFRWQKDLRDINFLSHSLKYVMGKSNLVIPLLTKLSGIKRRSHR